MTADNSLPYKHIKLSELNKELAEVASDVYGADIELLKERYAAEKDLGSDAKAMWSNFCDNCPGLRDVKPDDDVKIIELLTELHRREKKKGIGQEECQIAIEPPIEGEADIYELLDIFHKWLYFENNCDITIPVAFAVSNFTDTDPGCLGIIAPSGSYKTELLRAFGNEENEYVFPLDNLTPHTFVSGMKNVEDIVPQLTHRLILIKDFTTLLSKREDDRTAIFSDIREVLDGYLSRSYGSGKRVAYTDIHSSILLASTGAIERYYSLNATLGQRIIFFKPRNNPTKARERAFANMNKTAEMRKQLHVTTIQFLNAILKTKREKLSDVGGNIHDLIIDTLGRYADFVALARTHVLKDYKGEIAGVPEPEFPTRLFKEIVKIVSIHAIIHGRGVCVEDVQAGIRVLLSNIPVERFRLLGKLAEKEDGFHTPELASGLHLSRDVTRKRLEELLTLGIIDREVIKGSGGDLYQIKKDFLIVIRHLFNLDVLLFAWGGNPESGMYKKNFSYISKLQLTNSFNFNNNNHTNNVKQEKKVENEQRKINTHIPHSGLPPHTNHAKCEICEKVATLTSYNLDGKEIGICENCRKELEEKEVKINVSQISDTHKTDLVCICGKRFDTIEVLQEHQAKCKEFQTKQDREARAAL